LTLRSGILPNVPGFVMNVAPSTKASFPVPEHVPYLLEVYKYAWFVGFGIAGLVYLVGMSVGYRRHRTAE
jgi:NCS1 family nucleobase:cation symporter-1